MEFYARKLFELGGHSPELIQELCDAETVESFEWMKYFHKKAFLKYAGLESVGEMV